MLARDGLRLHADAGRPDGARLSARARGDPARRARRHIGFKDVGVPPHGVARAGRRDPRAGRDDVHGGRVSTSAEACLNSARVAREIGVERLLGGTQVDEVLAIIAGSATTYHPFPGKPVGHPTKLGGSPADVEADCRRFAGEGLRGRRPARVPRDRSRSDSSSCSAARRGTPGYLLVAGSVATPAQIRALQDAGADAFTVGSAAFDGSFLPSHGLVALAARSDPRCLAGDPIAQLLAGTYPDPETGELLRLRARARSRSTTRSRAREARARRWARPWLAIRGDRRRRHVRGARRPVASALASQFAVQRIVLGPHPALRRADDRRGRQSARARHRRRDRGRLRHDQRHLEDGRARARRPAGRVRHRAVDERLHVGERIGHRSRASSARCARARRSACSSTSACSPRRRSG